MANANRPSTPTPKDAQGQPHKNVAPFSPQTLTEVAPGGSVSKKGGLNAALNSDFEAGTGYKKPVWP